MRVTYGIKSGIQTAIELLYPPQCLGCGAQVLSDFGLCGSCWRDTTFIAGTVCNKCGAPVVGSEGGFDVECDDCMAHRRPWSHGRSALVYEGRARKLVLALKHGDRPEIAQPAAQWMAGVVQPIVQSDMVVVPVPLHWTRVVKRRYNQAALLADALSRVLELSCCPDLLRRRQRTPMLDHRSAKERHTLLADAVTLHHARRNRMEGKCVLLVDDVMTSGATLAACAQACHDGGARDVCVVTLARACRI